MAIKRKPAEFDEEKLIVTNLILSTDLCKKVLIATDPSFFNSKGVKVIIGWVKDHYSKYGEALGQRINEYYEINSAGLEPAIKDQVGNILEHLSEVNGTEVHNIDYLKDRAFTLYRKKFFENQIKVANACISKGDIPGAEAALVERFQYSEIISEAKVLNDKDLINESIQYIFKDEEQDVFFKFEGRFGDFVGVIEPGWLISFIAPPKTGKTVLLVEALISAIMQRKNVVFFSFEMPLKQLVARILRRVTGLCSPAGGTYYVPIFDCQSNQGGTCTKPERTGYGDNMNHMTDPPSVKEFEPDSDWVTCDACRGTKDFIPAAWKIPVRKDAVSESIFRRNVNSFMNLYAKFARLIFYPSRTCSIDMMNAELDVLIQRENFISELIMADYGDLIKPKKGKEKRHELDEIWEGLRTMGQSRQNAVITASQTNQKAVDSRYIKQTDIAEDFSKLAKLDVGIGLASTTDMKAAGILNANIVASRHYEFLISNTCTLLQDLGAMQGHLDSEY